MKLNINDENFKYYLRLFGIFYLNLFTKRLEKDVQLKELGHYDPIEKLRTLKKENSKIAKASLKEGIRESLTMIEHYPIETSLQIDAELRENGFGSLNELISLINDTVTKVLKRKRILKLDEYYIVKEKLDDLTSGITELEREILTGCLAEYELKLNKNPPMKATKPNS